MMNKHFESDEYYDEVFFETENFKVIPSLGSIVEGWLLVIPKTYYISYGRITDSILLEELDELINRVCKIVKIVFGDYIIFEHGPTEKLSKVGCGVDYAHLHIVPIRLTLEKVSSYEPSFNWEKIPGVSSVSCYTRADEPYLFFQDVNQNSFIGTCTEIPSQFFRRVIANILNVPQIFDWKKYYCLDNIKNTCIKLKKYNAKSNSEKLITYA